jgi:hypothetical protein
MTSDLDGTPRATTEPRQTCLTGRQAGGRETDAEDKDRHAETSSETASQQRTTGLARREKADESGRTGLSEKANERNGATGKTQPERNSETTTSPPGNGSTGTSSSKNRGDSGERTSTATTGAKGSEDRQARERSKRDGRENERIRPH